jgi:two-component system phosphate regulon response regulator PhoB
MSKGRILVVEDDFDISNMLRIYFTGQGFEVTVAPRGGDALTLTRKSIPHLIVLDIMLPDMDGYTVCKELRTTTRTSHIPIIFLTQKDERSDKIAGLELGADDYVTKPFSPRELVLRVESLLRRARKVSSKSELRSGPLHLDLKKLKFYIDDEPVDLTTTEFRLLTLLVENSGVTQKRADLLSEVWGYSDEVHTRTLDTHVKRLREKLGEYASSVETVRGEGYRFKDVAAAAKS